MAELTLKPDYLEMLLHKMRALRGGERAGIVNPASNAVDDPAHANLGEEAGERWREEVVREITSLDAGQQAELIALMWLGRGDSSPQEWDNLRTQAVERQDAPARYLLSDPQSAEFIADGMRALNIAA